MKEFELKGVSRSAFGKKEAKLLRSQDLVPCNIYGCGVNKMMTVSQADIRKLIYTPETYLVRIRLDDETISAVVQEIQFHPVSGNVLHIDFLKVVEDKPVTVNIPVTIEGHAEGVKAGGKLSLEMRKLKVKGLYSNIPDRITVDVTPLGLGKKLSVGDIKVDGLTMMNVADACVVQVKTTRTSATTSPTAETAAPVSTEK